MIDNDLSAAVDLFERSAPGEYASRLRELFKYHEASDIIAAFAEKYYYNNKRAAEFFREADVLQHKNSKIRTIASFYHRIADGGTERVITLLSGLWLSLGYKVLIFTDEPPSEEDYEVPDEVIRVVLPDTRYGFASFRERASAFQEALINYKVDLVVYHAWISDRILWDMLVCKCNGTMFAIHCHNVFALLASQIQKLFSELPYIYALADGVITLSETDRQFWSEFNNNVFKTVNPVKYTNIEDVPQSSLRGKTVIWCQRFSSEKRPEDAIEVFNLVHRALPESTLMLLGKGETDEYREKLEQRISGYNLNDSVFLMGYQRHVEDYYARADVCIITSDYEGFPLGLLESMEAGVPVVMYELPYLTLAEANKGIISVKHNDISMMAGAVAELLNNDAKRTALGKRAREAAQELLGFDYPGEWSRFFKRLESAPVSYRKSSILWDTLLAYYHSGVTALERRQEEAHKTAAENTVRAEEVSKEVPKEVSKEVSKEIPKAAAARRSSGIRSFLHKLLPSSRFNVSWSYEHLTEQLQSLIGMVDSLISLAVSQSRENKELTSRLEDLNLKQSEKIRHLYDLLNKTCAAQKAVGADMECRYMELKRDIEQLIADRETQNRSRSLLLSKISEAGQIPAECISSAMLLSDRKEAVRRLPKGGVAAELGVAYGDFSELILSEMKPRHFYAIDTFTGDIWNRHDIEMSGLDHEHWYIDRFKQYIPDKMTVLKGLSWEMLDGLEDDLFDYIYIDACHDYKAVNRDIEAAVKKLKSGGILQFNDYTLYDPIEKTCYGVVPAVNRLISSTGSQVLFYCLGVGGFDDIVIRVDKKS